MGHDAPAPTDAPGHCAVWVVIALLIGAGFVTLGTWQLQRRAWKLDLIERVERRVHAPAVAAPGPEQWPRLNAASDEYRRVRVSGRFIDGPGTRVQASTRLGPGFWIMVPLRTDRGEVVMVNRGFVRPDAPVSSERAHEIVTVTGLLRLSEPGGGFLRSNDPSASRWYSRDVQAIGEARGLNGVAPYFIDQDAISEWSQDEGPRGGMTVISFQNNHLIYAITWYALGLMATAAAWYLVPACRRWWFVST